MQQEFALAPGSMIVPRAIGVFRDVHSIEPRLSPVDVRIAVDERCTTGPQRLHLGTGEDQSGLIGVFDGVVVAGSAIGGHHFLATFPGHGSLLNKLVGYPLLSASQPVYRV